MALQPGSQLGPYEILAPLGAGGMGEVYKARDTQLGREVAIKTIASKRAGNEERKRRFLQEARAASALNHPGIVTIFDISRSGEVDYIVMEYLRGRTLDRLIGKQGLGVQESIRYALQIADALARAHAAGIIHRDLKPGNIMVTDEGQVKILDFGLAKLGDAEQAGENDATRTVHQIDGPHTQDGAVLGTVAYMSPEQAEGKKVDARCDIFSFGAVLYEMVTGRRAFSGDSSASTMAAVLKSEPKPPSQMVEGIPRDLERIILRCLRKDPARRFQHVTDLKVDLEELKETTDSGESAQPAAKTTRPSKLRWIAAAVALPVLVTVGWMLRPADEATAPPLEPVPLTSYEGVEREPSFSPDGSQVVFAWDGEKQDNYDLYVKVVGTGSHARLTTDPARDAYPAWSPDGRHIAFVRTQQGIFLIPPFGGSERKLVDWPVAGGQLSWSPDGKYLAFARAASNTEQAGIFLVAAQGGEARRITRAEGLADQTPAFSPDGRRLAFAGCTGITSCSLLVVELDTGSGSAGQVRRLAEPSGLIASMAWTSDGQALVFAKSGPRLWKVPLRGAIAPQLLSFAAEGSHSVAVSLSGSRLAYSYQHTSADLWRMEGGVVARSPLSSTRRDFSPQFSPDGRRVAFASNRSGNPEVWVANSDGSNAFQLTSSRFSGTPRWSPDGNRIVCDTLTADGLWDIQLIDAAGGQPTPIVRHAEDDKAPSFSRDGKWVYFSSKRGGRDEIYRIPATGGEPVGLTANGGWVAIESADGKSIYYTKTNRECSPLFVRSLDGGPERQVVESVCQRGFAVTERGIYHISGSLNDREHAVRLLDPATGRSSVVGRIEGRLFLDEGLTVSPDGRTILFSASTQAGADLMLVEGFR